MTVRHQHSASVRSSQIRTLYIGLDRTIFRVLCLYAAFTIYCWYFEIFHSAHSHIINHFLLYQPAHNVYSLHTFIVFLLHVSALHSPSSGRTFSALYSTHIFLQSYQLFFQQQSHRKFLKVQLCIQWSYSICIIAKIMDVTPLCYLLKTSIIYSLSIKHQQIHQYIMYLKLV